MNEENSSKKTPLYRSKKEALATGDNHGEKHEATIDPNKVAEMFQKYGSTLLERKG